ncbi:MAG: HlyC/CorC family transporter [Planctomycetaceae bacterium]|nr:HlyC/CorC family transporter [Planctomycetaceae bacterium]
MMDGWVWNLLRILSAMVLVAANGFFVAAEFALIKVRVSRIDELVAARRPFAKTAYWLAKRLEESLSACQLGITMASLGLGWVGEPAFAHLLEPLLRSLGVTSESVIHAISFIIAFTTITALHLVIGEQAPKIFALRRPEPMLLWCALPLKLFYVISYPLMTALNATTTWLLGRVGIQETAGHGETFSEQEIRVLLAQAHAQGELSRSEHRLIDAVFEFDDMICRRIMVPRGDVVFVDPSEPVTETMAMIRRTRHTRYPVCEGSLDEVLGVLHVKDLVGVQVASGFDLRTVMRPPRKVPENMPVSKLLRHFQGTHQLMAFVIDEYGTTIGIVTLENVLEEIIGDVADEFDDETPDIVPEGADTFIVNGATPLDEIERRFQVTFSDEDIDVDTLAGLLMHYAERMVEAGDTVQLPGFQAEVMESSDDRATRIRLTRKW